MDLTMKAVNELRLAVHDDWKEQMKKAIDAKDAVLQIQLTFVYFGIKWNKTTESDVGRSYYPREQYSLWSAYEQIVGTIEAERMNSLGVFWQVFEAAAQLGYLPAVLTCIERGWIKSHTYSFGFAQELLPYIEKGDSTIDYLYGRALRNGWR